VPRPKIRRRLRFNPRVLYFKPRGVPLRALSEVALALDEMEALKLYEVDGFDQVTAAKKMKVSQPTFARILDKAQKKIAEALVSGKAIRIESVS
jgi:predicted DNA-binding protein (UPF0251 family)